MRRRIDLAVGLVNDPQVIYLDEPTTGLDPRARNAVWDTVRELVRNGATVLLTTQTLDEAEALADQIVVFDRGRVVADGTAEELKEKIGGQTLAVRARDRDRLPEVVRIVARVAGTRTETDEDTGLVTAPLDDPAALAAVVRGLDEAGVVASELALRRPSLDEVFLSLTGHHAESEGTDE
jgi:oleandomycin transport system ATP-binding protein